MGDVGDDDEWIAKMSRNFRRLELTDEETGECWMPSRDEESSMLVSPSSTSSSVGGCQGAMACLPGRWRVPVEYSKLGRSPSPAPGMAAAGYDFKQNEVCNPEDTTSGTLVATFPTVGKVPFFCRKRRASQASSNQTKEPAKKNVNMMEHFLEGREELRPFVLVGRLFFAFLVLLSPGFVFPFLIFVRIFCHVQRHNTCYADEHASAAIMVHQAFPFGFLRPGTIFKYSCRFCREDMKSERLLRIHRAQNQRKLKGQGGEPNQADAATFSSTASLVTLSYNCKTCPSHHH